ncbi:MAG: hypothetical protein KDD55_06860 [Bdellovibrionales bacterium]|nr:hypothetical protein [Bdellovibrionales bacterium]
MLLIQTALRCEAEPFIQHYKLVQDDAVLPYKFFRGETTALLISGVGQEKAEAATEWIFSLLSPSLIDLYVNLGIAGSVTHPIGTPVVCTTILNAETKEQFQLHSPSDLKLPQGTLETHLTPVGSSECLLNQDSLVDMEAYFCLRAASQFLPLEKIQVIKVVSDALSDKKPTKEHVTQLLRGALPDIETYLANYLNL